MLLIKNCKIVFGEYKDAMTGEIKDIESIQDIFIKNGKIEKIKRDLKAKEFISSECTFNNGEIKEIKIIDAQYNYVIPGIIDVHTHMRDPGLTYKEDFISGSKACARGGVTTFIDMPNTIPPTITEKNLVDKVKNSIGRSYVDYGFHFGGSNDDNSLEIKKVIDKVASTKIFLNMSTGNMLINNNNSLKHIFETSKIISVHAEEEKVEEAIKFAMEYDKPLYLCHISTKDEVELIKRYKEKYNKIYAEVAPHHIFLNRELREKSPENMKMMVMKPELKGIDDNLALIEGIKNGVIDTIGTDHAPHTLDEKREKTTYGIPSVENSLEMMLNLVEDKKITLYKLTKIMSENPAEIFGISNKGKLLEGYDGDLVIIDRKSSYTINNENIVSKSNWTPYVGFKTGGKVLKTILRGKIVYNNGKFLEELCGTEINYK